MADRKFVKLLVYEWFQSMMAREAEKMYQSPQPIAVTAGAPAVQRAA